MGINSTTAQPVQKIYSDLNKATSISVTQNSIYVVEEGKDRLLKLDHFGKLQETVGGRGSGDYQFSKPLDVDVTNGLKIFVTDYNNRRVQVFDRRGQYLSSISNLDSFGVNRRYNPTQISVSKLGEVYFVDEEVRHIYQFDLDYNLMDEIRISSEVRSVDELIVTSDEMFILDKSTDTIHRLAPNGSYRGFYPADGAQAVFVNEAGMWTAYSDRVVFEPETGEPSAIEFAGNIQPVDMHYLNGFLFILTHDALLKIATVER